MEKNEWFESPPKGVSCISICSPNEGDLSKHWFKDYIVVWLKDAKNFRVFNLDIDDISPFWFENHESKCYDDALDLYNEGRIKQSNAYFSYLYISGPNKEWVDIVHALDYEEAYNLVKWIDWRIKHDETIYIHCAVGASRSQGVVRYIVDTYGAEYDIRLNPDNPNNTYNPHVVMMLKRAYRELFMNCDDDEVTDKYFETEPIKFNEDIKINLI
jgi:hypothetical protein